MLIALAKYRSVRGASHQPAFMSGCLTISHTCLPREWSGVAKWERCVSGAGWQGGKGGRIVRWHGRRGRNKMRWQFGKGGRV